ncbi:MAG: tetratricopeptide repeat protein [Planctomycetota bacterium]|nr:tetratricopeptide repeat protein [Planctomycetota bacterium]
MKRLISPRAPSEEPTSSAAFAALLTVAALVLSAGCGPGRSAPRPEPLPRPQADLSSQIDLADADFGARRFVEARERYREVHAAASSDGPDALAGEAAAMIAATTAMIEVPGTPKAAEGDVWMERAEAASTDEDPGAWTRVLLARALRSLRALDVERARGTFIYLYNYSSGANRPSRALEAAYMASLSSRGPEQIDWMRRAIEAARVLGDPAREAPLWTFLGEMLDQDDEVEAALDAFSTASDMIVEFEPSGSARQRAELNVCRALRRAGRPQEACDRLERLRVVAQSQHVQDQSPASAELLGSVLEQLGEAHAALGRTERARELFRGAQQMLGEAGQVRRARARARGLTERIEALDRPATGRVVPPQRR